MAVNQTNIGIIVYAPALRGDDGRPLAIVHGMEGAIPGLRLGWTFSEREVFTGWENPNGLAAGGSPHLEVYADLPLDTAGIAAVADVLEAVAEGARAFWGHATPFDAGVAIAEQTSPALVQPLSIPGGYEVRARYRWEFRTAQRGFDYRRLQLPALIGPWEKRRVRDGVSLQYLSRARTPSLRPSRAPQVQAASRSATPSPEPYCRTPVRCVLRG
ncbi:DUF5953 family protein [Stigmatella sp. ncwal1]|uniref:DUF5953 family protein n=1 Tax=Stigmatella ashevillensis TaxID=2995309 RepID=A0ABT5DMT7_9BACT|nr:DUF5953 family protein [Stigmatella ashevillena]